MERENPRLFHISEDPKINVFVPRLSPSHFNIIKADVVMAVSENLVHNYMLPKECPRLSYHAGPDTTPRDTKKFFGFCTAAHIMAVENRWIKKIQSTTLYCYEFDSRHFSLFDESTGDYTAYKTIVPISIKPIYSILDELLKRNIELRFMPTIDKLAMEIRKSSLHSSLIKIRGLEPEKLRRRHKLRVDSSIGLTAK